MARNTKKRSTPRSGSNMVVLLGLVISVAVGVTIAIAYMRADQTAEVLVTKTEVKAFAQLRNTDFEVKKVPAKSIDPNTDLTPETYNRRVRDGAIVSRVELVAGQRIPVQALGTSQVGSYEAVRATERVVAVSASFNGTAAGLSVPGTIVDLYTPGAGTGGGQALMTDVKVLGLGLGSNAAAGVGASGGSRNGQQASSGTLTVLLIVPESRVGDLAAANYSVHAALNPAKRFNQQGVIAEVKR